MCALSSLLLVLLAAAGIGCWWLARQLYAMGCLAGVVSIIVAAAATVAAAGAAGMAVGGLHVSKVSVHLAVVFQLRCCWSAARPFCAHYGWH